MFLGNKRHIYQRQVEFKLLYEDFKLSNPDLKGVKESYIGISPKAYLNEGFVLNRLLEHDDILAPIISLDYEYSTD